MRYYTVYPVSLGDLGVACRQAQILLPRAAILSARLKGNYARLVIESEEDISWRLTRCVQLGGLQCWSARTR